MGDRLELPMANMPIKGTYEKESKLKNEFMKVNIFHKRTLVCFTFLVNFTVKSTKIRWKVYK